jgi:hypothetical protein
LWITFDRVTELFRGGLRQIHRRVETVRNNPMALLKCFERSHVECVTRYLLCLLAVFTGSHCIQILSTVVTDFTCFAFSRITVFTQPCIFPSLLHSHYSNFLDVDSLVLVSGSNNTLAHLLRNHLATRDQLSNFPQPCPNFQSLG